MRLLGCLTATSKGDGERPWRKACMLHVPRQGDSARRNQSVLITEFLLDVVTTRSLKLSPVLAWRRRKAEPYT